MFLHLIPNNALASAYFGSYKDIISRVNWFRSLGADYLQLAISNDVGELDGLPPVPSVRGILVEYTHFPKTIAFLRQRYPKAFLAARAHNIEPLQHLHVHGWWPARGPAWMLYGMWRRFRQDVLCKRHCDAIYSINSYENRVYWDRLPGRARIKWLPYFCPEHLIPDQPVPFRERNIIACLPANLESRRNRDTVARFIRFARVMKSAGSPFRFIVSGDLSKSGLLGCDAVESAGTIEDLGSFLGQVRAVAVLSPLGFGLKTTIVDAIACGAFGLAHPVIAKRSPRELLPGLISVDTEGPLEAKAIELIAEGLNCPAPFDEIACQFKTRALAALERDFGASAIARTSGEEYSHAFGSYG